MRLCRHRVFGIASLVVLPVFAAASPVWCQTASRPAAVLLVATLETVSVRADSPDASTVSFANDTRRVTLTTAFAVPADRTTVRLAGRFDAGPEDSSSAFSLSAAADSAVRLPAIATPGGAGVLHPGEGDVVLFSQPAGNTNWPVSRTDNLNLQWGPSSGRRSAPADTSGTLEIFVQAL